MTVNFPRFDRNSACDLGPKFENEGRSLNISFFFISKSKSSFNGHRDPRIKSDCKFKGRFGLNLETIFEFGFKIERAVVFDPVRNRFCSWICEFDGFFDGFAQNTRENYGRLFGDVVGKGVV